MYQNQFLIIAAVKVFLAFLSLALTIILIFWSRAKRNFDWCKFKESTKQEREAFI